METIKKREQKHAKKVEEAETSRKKKESEEVKLESKYRMNINFTALAGDDTGLIKKVRMAYNYQTDIIGSYMVDADESFKELDNT